MRPEHVFVLCTGRCGSTTFVESFRHCSNYSAGHETRSHLTGKRRLAFPKNHIEADNRLSWCLGRLDQAFGTQAFYVHLTRDPEAVAASFEKRADKGIMLAYRTEILLRAPRRNKSLAMREFCRDYVDTVTQNILFFLRDKPNQMAFSLETADRDLPLLWEQIGAEGDLEAARNEWQIRYNASPED